MTLGKLIALLHDNPCRRFGIGGDLTAGCTVFDLNETYGIDPRTFLSMGRSTPFAGRTVSGKCMLTVSRGKIAYLDPTLKARTK